MAGSQAQRWALYVVDTELCGCHHTGVGVLDTHNEGVISLLGLGFPPRFEQMAQGRAEEERTVSSRPGPLGGLCILPAGLPACPEVLQLSFLTAQPGCLLGLDRVLSMSS